MHIHIHEEANEIGRNKSIKLKNNSRMEVYIILRIFETFWWLATQLLKRRKKIKRKKGKHVHKKYGHIKESWRFICLSLTIVHKVDPESFV
jgi:hypothetical protein